MSSVITIPAPIVVTRRAARPTVPCGPAEAVDGLARRLRALDCTGDVWLRKGDAGEAAREAGRCLQLDPYHEPAVRRLMRAAAASGDHAAVARAYDAFRQRLNDELGVVPAPETTDLRHRLLMEGRRDT